MKLKQFFTDDDAVSPVIGVILMVAITVILAAVIASFVLGLGDTTDTTPTASFDFEYVDDDGDGTNDAVKITHQTGDTLDQSEVKVKVNGATQSVSWGGEIKSGVSVTVDNGGSDLTGGETVTVVWESSDGESSSTLGSFDVPN
ncbi:type IV pilin N-terminal domain-containing protein [Halapricum hydrolyticum]|uniref:Type IV pilin N-terminal domain-containing protein n=1 Tax=Halapricum hydrolyticum TaxID=2979991 RepID=A0AAE3I8Z3_9EURY|nr:type IV pilin N-terminal domain-containing protein [Halapricum hydrolyticum]MCU4716803.1 type IV pilin N-terminal domain-containing protein [Halapricum hydrolyticum]MCU4725592.1 type IV pilin N-terminal domain-containing protein [Halapricum hydrolyticum]